MCGKTVRDQKEMVILEKDAHWKLDSKENGRTERNSENLKKQKTGSEERVGRRLERKDGKTFYPIACKKKKYRISILCVHVCEVLG